MTCSLECAWLPTRVWSNALMRMAKGQGGATLLMECTTLQKLKKKENVTNRV